MLVSVIIPTRHRPTYVAELLESLKAQNPVDFSWEVLILDNGDAGREDTARVCAESARGFPVPLRCIRAPEPGLHVGRNLGALKARGDILAYLDDDMLLAPGWLSGVSLVRRGAAQAVVGRIKPFWDRGVDPDRLPEWADEVWDGKCSGYWGLIDLGDEPKEVAPDWIAGGNSFVLRRLVLDLGGFHPDGLPSERTVFRGDGETGFYRALSEAGHRTMYDPAGEALHRVTAEKITLEYILDRAFRQGVSESYSRIRAAGGVDRPWYALINDAYLKGQIFHREAVRRDPNLLAWVLRNHYLPSREVES